MLGREIKKEEEGGKGGGAATAGSATSTPPKRAKVGTSSGLTSPKSAATPKTGASVAAATPTYTLSADDLSKIVADLVRRATGGQSVQAEEDNLD